MKDNKREQEKPVLMTEMMRLLALCKAECGQERVFNRVLALVMAELFVFGRHTVTQLLMTLGLVEEDWSAWYRLFSKGRFAEERKSAVLLREMLQEVDEKERFVMGVDGFHVPRASKTMPGSGWMKGLNTASFKPGIERGQRFVEGSWLTPLSNGYSRAVPMRCLSAFTAKAEACEGEEPRTEVAAGLEILQWTRAEMDAAGRQEQELLTLNDGSYDSLEFWAGLPERTTAIVRTARNRCLYHLPADDAHGNRKYGDKAPAPHEWLKKRKGFNRKQVTIRARQRPMRYRIEGPFLRDGLSHIPLMLVVIGGGKRPIGSRRKNYKPCFFLVSAVQQDGVWLPAIPLNDLLAWLWQRWELEIAHRQMKTGLGLGEKQCWNDRSTVATVQWSVWVYALMLLSGIRAWGNSAGSKPPGLWRSAPKRWSFNTLTRAFRSEMWLHSDFRATWTWSRDNWLTNEPLWDNLFNSTLASVRL